MTAPGPAGLAVEAPSVVYGPEPMLKRPGLLVRAMIRDLFAARGLARQLASRDIRALYRQTALGLLWAFLLPVANGLIWLFLHGSGLIVIRDTGMPYAVFVFTGTTLWAIFMDAVNAPLRQTTAARPMLARINFPREALILSGIYQTIFHAVIRITVLIAALLAFGTVVAWPLAFAPAGVLVLILAGTGLGIALTPLGMLYADVGRALPPLMQFLMFLSPVVYPIPSAGIAATVLQWSPLTPLIAGNRALLIGQVPGDPLALALVSLLSVGLLLLSWLAYRLAMPILIERMGA